MPGGAPFANIFPKCSIDCASCLAQSAQSLDRGRVEPRKRESTKYAKRKPVGSTKTRKHENRETKGRKTRKAIALAAWIVGRWSNRPEPRRKQPKCREIEKWPPPFGWGPFFDCEGKRINEN